MEKVSCQVCGQSLSKDVMYGIEKFWCRNHFTCAICNVKLSQYREQNSRAYCMKCYEKVRPVCVKCKKHVQDDQEFINCDKQYWHEETCFECTKCMKKADVNGFFIAENKVFCKGCTPVNTPQPKKA